MPQNVETTINSPETLVGMIEITDYEFTQIARLVRDRFGISLSERKKALVRGRLSSLLRRNGYRSFAEYLDAVERDQSGEELRSLIDRVSTNHSYLFREADHFEHIIGVAIPRILEQIGRDDATFHLWSAGCAEGEEPFTLAMVLSEYMREHKPRWTASILATDVSTGALQAAQRAEYPANRIAEVPERYHHYLTATNDGRYRVVDSIRDMVLFKRLNLMNEEFPFRSRFDVVMCRNVMIYFDQDTRADLVSRIARYVQPGGFLYIGHSETLGRSSAEWNYIRPTVYQRWTGK